MSSDELLTRPMGALFARFCTASVLGMIGISIYILADTFFIANGIGANALAALNIAIPGFTTVSALGILLGIGCATCYAFETGMGTPQEEAQRYYRVGVLAAVVIGSAFCILGQTCSRPVSYMLGADETTIADCADYLRVTWLFAPAFLLNQVYLAFIRNLDKPRVAMVSMLAGSVFNVVMDYVFIYVWRFGVQGAALATAGSPIVGLCISIPVATFGKGTQLHLGRIDWKEVSIKRILSGGVSSFIVELSLAISLFLVNALMLRLEGTIGVAAYGIVANIAFVPAAIFTGEGQALQPIVSMNYGAGKKERTYSAFRIAAVTALVSGIAFWLIGVLDAQGLVAAFNRDADPHLQALAVRGVDLYFTAFIPMGVNVILSYFFQAVLNVRDSVLISVLRGLVIISVLAILFAYVSGTEGVWIATTVTESITLAYGLFALRSWRQKAARQDALN